MVYETLLTEAELDVWIAKISAAKLTAIDTETTSLDEQQARIVGISTSVEVGNAAYVPVAHDGPDAPEQLPIDLVLAKLKPWLEDASHKKLGQHIKYGSNMYSPITASTCRATSTTPCSKATCSKCTNRTVCRALPIATRAARRHHL